MGTSARLAIPAWRNEPCTRTIYVDGLDLTNSSFGMQVRLKPDTPGDPLIDLATVTTVAQGIQFRSVDTSQGRPISQLTLRINKSTLQALPYTGELGEDTWLAYALQIDGATRAYGDFVVRASAYGSDAAPTQRTGDASMRTAMEPWDRATLTYDSGSFTIKIDGADAVGAIATEVAAAKDAAVEAKEGAEAAAASVEETAAELRTSRVQLPFGRSSFAVMDRYGLSIGRMTLESGWESVGTAGAGGFDLDAFARKATFDVRAKPVITPGIWLAFFHGQSKSVGYHSLDAFSTASAVDFMLSGGVHTTHTDDFSAQTLAPLHEANAADVTLTGNDGETPASGFCEAVHWLIEKLTGIAPADQGFAFVAAVSGVSGASAATILNPSTYYTRQLAVMARVKELAAAEGLPFTYVGGHVNQGQRDTEIDTDPTTWKGRWTGWHTAIEGEGEALSGDRPATVSAITQICDHSFYEVYDPAIARAIGELDEVAGWTVSAPDYFLETLSALDLHYKASASKLTGIYSGLAFVWRYVLGVDWQPLKPTGQKLVNGRGVTIPFHVPVRPLRLSTDIVSDPGDYGFVLRKTSDGSAIDLASVTVVGDAVRLLASADLPSQDEADFYVEYAYGPASAVQPGPTTGARGCLCDSQGDFLSIDVNGTAVRLDNYALLSRI